MGNGESSVESLALRDHSASFLSNDAVAVVAALIGVTCR